MQGRIAEMRVRFHKNPQSLFFAPLADLLRQAGEFEEALMLLEDGLVRHPDYQSAMVVLGQTLFDTGRSGHARRILQRVLQRDPENLVALQALAVDAVDAGDLSRAVPLLEQLVSLEPENAHWDKTLVRCRQELRGGPEPEAPSVPAPEVEPAGPAAGEPSGIQEDAAFATMTLVDIYLSQGYHAKAMRALRRMADRFPDQVDIRRKIAEVEALAGTGGEAAAAESGEAAKGRSTRRQAEKKQFQEWLDCLEPGDEGSP